MKIKCVIWDLDNTIWEGTLKDSNNIKLKPGIEKVLQTLNERGIIQSIVSKNYEKHAIKKLQELDIEKYFVFPQISYSPKTILVKKILEFINVDEEFVAYIDDDEFELNEIKNNFRYINLYKSDKYQRLLNYSEFQIKELSLDSIKRTQYLKTKERRIKDEKNYNGSKEEFMKNSNTVIKIHKFNNKSMDRVIELVGRTNKYNNVNGSMINKEYISDYSKGGIGNIIIFDMQDRYGDYGTIGTIFFKIIDHKMIIDIFCISCRILGRGIAISIFSNIINHLFEEKRIKEVLCKINYTEKNRESIILLNLLNFDLKGQENNILEFNLKNKIDVVNEEFINVIFEEKT